MNGQWLESVRNIAALTLVLLKTNLFSFGDMVSGGRPAGSKTKRDKKRGNRANRGDQASSGDQANHGDQPSRVDQANRDRTLSRGHIVFLIILPLCLLPATASICLIAWQFIGAAKAQGLEHILIGLYLSAIALATMALGLYHVMNIFYLANDTESLLPLPLRPHEILIARFLTVLAYELVAQFFLLAPALVVYGIRSGTPLFWVYAIIFYILFPLAPLVLSSLLALLIKPVIDRIRNSDTVTGVMNALLLFMICAVSLLSGRLAMLVNVPAARVSEMLNAGDTAVFGTISRLIPTIRFSALAFSQSGTLAGFGYFVVFLVLNVGFMALFALIGKLFYLKGGMGATAELTTRGSGGRRFDGEAFAARRTGSSSVLWLYAKKEIRILVRTPIYFLNCVSVNFIWPALILLSLFTNIMGTGGDTGGGSAGGADQLAAMGQLLEGFSEGGILPFLLSFGFAAGLFMGCMNSIAATALSREGSDFYFNKYTPLTFDQILWGKILPSLIFGGGILAVILAVFIAAFGLPLWALAPVLPASAAGLLLQGFTGLAIDFTMPKLNWTSEHAAVKQNLNTLFNMGLAFLAAAAPIVLAFVLYGRADSRVSACLVAALALASTAAAWYVAGRVVGPRRLRAI